MPSLSKRPQTQIALFALCAASLTLTACGSRLQNNHAHNSGACGAYVQSCASPTRYGHAGYNSGAYESPTYAAYQAPYVQSYPALRPSYIPTQQSVVSYVPMPASAPMPTPMPTPAPVSIPTPIYEPGPSVEYIPEPAVDYGVPLSSWAPAWRDESGRDESDCPEGTIQGYGGSGCVQVAIPRK